METHKLLDLDDTFSPMFTITLFLTITWGAGSRMVMIKHALKVWNKIWKPINLLYIVDLSFQLIFIGITLLLYLLAIWTSAPLNDLIGHDLVGWVFQICIIIGVVSLYIFSVIMAVIRVIYFKLNRRFVFNKIGEMGISLISLVLGIMTITALIWMWVTSDDAMALELINLAAGRSGNMVDILWCYEDGRCGDEERSLNKIRIALTVYISLNSLLEFFCYCYLVYAIYHHDRYTMESLISEEARQKRKEKNVQTFKSAVMTFIMEQLFLMVAAGFMDNNSVRPFSLLVVHMGLYAIHPIPGILASQSLRKVFSAPLRKLFKAKRG